MSRHDWGRDYAVPIRRAAGHRDRVRPGGGILIALLIVVGVLAALRVAGIL